MSLTVFPFQYGSPSSGGTYNYWDEVALNPPANAVYATIDLLYQSTSWEYIQFLYLANDKSNAFLADEGVNLLNAWLNTGMAEPVVMASMTWDDGTGTGPEPPSACTAPGTPESLTAKGGKRSVTLKWSAGNPAPTGGHRIYYDQSGKLQFRAGVSASTLSYKDSGLARNNTYCYVVTAWTDCGGDGAFDATVDTESTPTAVVCAKVQ